MERLRQFLLDSPKAAVDLLLALLGTMILFNIMLAVTFDVRELGFKLVSMWIVLLSLCLVSRNLHFSAVLIGLILCLTCEVVCYFGVNHEVMYQKIAPVIFADFVLLTFFDLLAATKIDNAVNRRNFEYELHKKTQQDCLELEEKLRAKEMKEKEKGSEKDGGTKGPKRDVDSALEIRRLTLEMQKSVYTSLLKVRSRKDVPKLLEGLFGTWFKIGRGIIVEMSVDGPRDPKIAQHWGINDKAPETRDALEALRTGQILRWAEARRDFTTAGEMHKDTGLFTELQAFTENLFDLHSFLPIVAQDKLLFILFLGQARDPELEFEDKLLQPILGALITTLGKIGSR